MKFVKENDNGFSVSISKKELQALGVRLEDLRYGNATTASFLREILFRARVELDFEPTDDGMRTEIIPKADGGVELVYTFSDEFEETDPRYATFSPFIQEQAYKNYYNEDDEDAFYTPTDPDTEVPFGDFSDDAGIAGLNEVMKNESASDEDTPDESPDDIQAHVIEFDYMQPQNEGDADPNQTQIEEFMRQLKENGEATASFSIFVDGTDISKDANASQSFDRFMNYLVKGSSGNEFFTPFKNLISKLRNLSGAKAVDVSTGKDISDAMGTEAADGMQKAEPRDTACSIPATAQEGKKPLPADTKTGRASHGTRTKTGKPGPAPEPTLTQDMLFVFRFNSFDDACRAAVCAGPYSGKNSLYKSPAPENAYYLLMHTVGATAHAVNSTCSIFQEFGKIVSRENFVFESYAKEHFECLIVNDAILHLCEIGA